MIDPSIPDSPWRTGWWTCELVVGDRAESRTVPLKPPVVENYEAAVWHLEWIPPPIILEKVTGEVILNFTAIIYALPWPLRIRKETRREGRVVDGKAKVLFDYLEFGLRLS